MQIGLTLPDLSTSDGAIPVTVHEEQPATPAWREWSSRRRVVAGRRVGGPILGGVAALGVFFVHFRPWQGGLLEDWGLALAWENEGIGGFAARIPATLGRPFELLPHYVGMALSGGGFVGPYAMLGLIALAQLAAGLWAVAPLTRFCPLRWAAALAIAVHPWWAPGDILRFMPAQVAVLGVVVWFGAALRFMDSGRRALIPILVVAPMLGLLTYQAPAAARGQITILGNGRFSGCGGLRRENGRGRARNGKI